jgi:hypothetical protein
VDDWQPGCGHSCQRQESAQHDDDLPSSADMMRRLRVGRAARAKGAAVCRGRSWRASRWRQHRWTPSAGPRGGGDWSEGAARRQRGIRLRGLRAGRRDVAQRPDGLLAHLLVRRPSRRTKQPPRRCRSRSASGLCFADATLVRAQDLELQLRRCRSRCRSPTKRAMTPGRWMTCSDGGLRSD